MKEWTPEGWAAEAEAAGAPASSPARKSRKRGPWAWRLAVGLTIAAALLAVALLALGSESGREYIGERLGNYLGMRIDVRKARPGWPCALVLEQVESRGFRNFGTAGLRADEVRLEPGLEARWQVTLRGAELHMVQAPGGHWAPAAFEGVGDLLGGNVSDVSHLTSSFREGLAARSEQGVVRWFNESGVETAQVSGVTFRVSPVSVPGQRLYYHQLRVTSGSGPGHEPIADTGREWLASDARWYLEIQRSDGSGGGKPDAFWQVSPKAEAGGKQE